MEAVNTLTIKDASDPRIGFLADEIRKVRQKRKAADPKFKTKKTKISADSFKKQSPVARVRQKALPGTAMRWCARYNKILKKEEHWSNNLVRKKKNQIF